VNIKPEDIERVEADTTKQVELCLCSRYVGQPLPSGARIDLRCSECNHRVAADPNTVRFHTAGARLICRECVPRETADAYRSGPKNDKSN
jgi:hypothetical protein